MSIRVTKNRQPEKELQSRILKVFGAMPEVRLFRANVGVASPPGRDYLMKFGVVGQADLNGIVAPSGRRLEIEVKSPTGRRRPEQIAWGEMIQRFGGIYVVARSVDDVFLALAAAGVELRFAPPLMTQSTPAGGGQ